MSQSGHYKPLLPSEVPENIRSIFNYEVQYVLPRIYRGKKSGYSVIEKTCPRCFKKAMMRVVHLRHSFQVGKAFTGYCNSCDTTLRRIGIKGSLHPSWKGGRIIGTRGYVRVAVSNYPSGKRYILEHRLVMESIMGRYLAPWERVHHRNGITDDNRPENLELWTTNYRKDPYGVRYSDLPKPHCPSCTC